MTTLGGELGRGPKIHMAKKRHALGQSQLIKE